MSEGTCARCGSPILMPERSPYCSVLCRVRADGGERGMSEQLGERVDRVMDLANEHGQDPQRLFAALTRAVAALIDAHHGRVEVEQALDRIAGALAGEVPKL